MGVSPRTGALVGEKLGKYDVLALLAIGGTAEIYLARIVGEAGFEKYVVIKCLLDHLADDPDFVRMFLDEARLGAQLDHSNIVQTLELGQHDGRYFMAMEYLAGLSLAQLARKTHEREPSGVVPVELVIGMAAQAAGGLHYAHQRTATDGTHLKVVHRDVSPQNLVVTFEGILKIVDFGIAKAEQRQTHTRSGTIKGKFAYMSPEQCMAEPIDRRTDIFALGTVVHELLTARRLFKRNSTYETYQAIVKGNVPAPSRYNDAVDENLDKALLRALAYHKEDRYETAEEFGQALLGWLHGRGSSVSASDVSRFVDRVCAQEIEDHAEHMRELISGRSVTGAEHLWDTDAEGSESNSLSAEPLDGSDLVGSELDDSGDFGGDTEIELEPGARLEGMGFQVPSPEPTNPQAGGKAGASGDQKYNSADDLATVAGKGDGHATSFPPRGSSRDHDRPMTAPTVAGGTNKVAGSQPATRKSGNFSEAAVAATILHDSVTDKPIPASAQKTLFAPDPQAGKAPQADVDPVGQTAEIGQLFATSGRRAEDPLAVYDTPPPTDEAWKHQEQMRKQLEAMPRAQALPSPQQRLPPPSPIKSWVLVLAFFASVGVALGVTALIVS